MKKVLLYLYNNMADFEVTLACDSLSSIDGIELITFAQNKNNVEANSKLKYVPDMTLEETLKIEDIDALIIPGGYERICSDNLVKLIKSLDYKKKLLAAICAAPEFLAKSEVLQGHKFTTSLNKEYYTENNIEDKFQWDNYVDEKAVRDSNIITAKGNAFVEFAAEICDYLGAFQNAEEKQEFCLYFK
ncbi:Putative intracellular protease/amidase [Hathewaya proteolytica DSM 3090]|uniref:Putative intracellular protease/amidase n=1 Tax=Hathewaya proteolytica DSM 3090 TaxID=1121331 RepID=A0A1M6JR36_9CLOT|nr:DJ-1/PfpI family protein [Hathewaya proteolytica]SHJ49149.1 Putative intracellular protease/amidase [Hathewaya proteolytica DSM 3090]